MVTLRLQHAMAFCERMVGSAITDLLPTVFQVPGGLLQRFTIEQRRIVAGRIFALVKVPMEAEHYVEGGRIVRVTARVTVLRLLLVATTARLCAYKKQKIHGLATLFAAELYV